MTAALKITLYDAETNEVRREFVRSFVPWRLLKAAIRLSKKLGKLDLENLTEEDIDAIAGLVVEAFGNQFTLDELNDGADLGEMITVMNAIVAKANGATGVPLAG